MPGFSQFLDQTSIFYRECYFLLLSNTYRKTKIDKMKRLVTVAEFPTAYAIKYSLLKDMLEHAEIPYFEVNENMRGLKPFPISPSNISIEIKVYEEYLEEVQKILQSIK